VAPSDLKHTKLKNNKHTTGVSSIRCGLFINLQTVNWNNTRMIPKRCWWRMAAD